MYMFCRLAKKGGWSSWKRGPLKLTSTVSYSTDIEWNGWGLRLRIHLRLRPRLRISGAVPPPPPHMLPYGAHASSTYLKIKPTRWNNFSNLFLEWNSTCFGQFLCPSSGVFQCTHSNGICHTGLVCVQWKTPDDGQRNCPKHVEFHSKNKLEKWVHLVGFILWNLSRCTVTWTSESSTFSQPLWMLRNK